MQDILTEVDRALIVYGVDGRQGGVIKRCEVQEPATIRQAKAERSAWISQPMFQIAVKDTVLPSEPAARLRREITMNLLSEILFCRAAAFYNELFEKGIMTTNYFYAYSTTNGAAYHSVSGEASDPEAVFEAYERVVDDARHNGVCREDFERCRKVLYAGYVSQFDSTEDVADLMGEMEK